MATVIHASNMQEGYLEVCDAVYTSGAEAAPRGQKTRELLDLILVLSDPTRSVASHVGRKLHMAIGIAEALQLIGGTSEPELMTAIAPAFTRFRSASGSFYGAYGVRIGNQLAAVERKLRDDPDTRQAVVTLWDPVLDNLPGEPDYPCTVMLQFLIREERLIMHTTMRSNDVWWGLPYDVFQFTQLQCTLAHVLGVRTGEYRHHAISMHAYERDFNGIKKLHAPDMSDPVKHDGLRVQSIFDARRLALKMLTGRGTWATSNERWMSRTMMEYTVR